MDISILTHELSPQEKPGLDIFDPRFDEIVSLVDNADYLTAAYKVEEAMNQGIYDLRLMGFFTYGYFLEHGPASLTEILSALVYVLEESFENFGPVKNREKQASSSLKWFFQQLIKKVQYEEKRNTDVWHQWQQETSVEQVDDIIEQCEVLAKALRVTFEDKAGPLLESNTKLNGWLMDFRSMAVPIEEAVPVEEEEAEPEVIEVESATVISENGFVPLAGSSKLQTLELKIAAFCTLCQRGDIARAAIIMEDLEDIISNFKPQEYYPTQFTNYFSTMAIYIREMAPYWQDKNSISWQALERLYDVDPKSFLNLDI